MKLILDTVRRPDGKWEVRADIQVLDVVAEGATPHDAAFDFLTRLHGFLSIRLDVQLGAQVMGIARLSATESKEGGG